MKEKGEIDKILEKAILEKRKYEELERKFKDLQTKYQLQTKQMDDLKGRYRSMESELLDLKGKHRGLLAEMKKREEEEKKNSSSLLSYIPFSAPAVPNFSISSWVWGAANAEPGPLVRKYTGTCISFFLEGGFY